MRAPKINHDGKIKDYYEFFGIKQDAGPEDLKQAYRRLCKHYHPDVNKDKDRAEKNFKVVQEVWDVLSSQSKRSRYDQLLKIERGVSVNVEGMSIRVDFGYNTSPTASWYPFYQFHGGTTA